MHREPPRAAPSPGENRGHRRFQAPLLPVSRLIAACHVCAIRRAQGQAGNTALRARRLFYSTASHMCYSECGKLVGSSHYCMCRWSSHLRVNYGMKYVLKLECESVHGCECCSQCGVRRQSTHLCKHDAYAASAADT